MTDNTYILRDKDGDFVKKVTSGTTETVKCHFDFTKDIRQAKLFSYEDLFSPQASMSVGQEFAKGFAGGKAISLEGRTLLRFRAPGGKLTEDKLI